MNASDFVNVLSASAPSFKSLCSLGLNDTEAESIRATHFCVLRNTPTQNLATNELTELVTRWDTNKVEIGMVWLRGIPTLYQNRGLQVGSVEVDPLIITDNDSEVIVEEDRVPGHLLWKAARSPGQFLDALALAAKFLSDRTVGAVDFDDLDAAKAAANKCAVLAGGDEYAGFYFMLLGAE